ASTVRDFYAYLGQVVTRHYLVPEEISGFRNLLVEYIQMVVEDVLRYTPGIAEVLTREQFVSARPQLLALLDSTGSLGADVERQRGRTSADWDELTDWFVDRPGRPSQVAALRDATGRAINTLLATVKRATSSGGPEPGRRGQLLKLAKWFDESSPEMAHTLAAAAFGLYSSRNLLLAPDQDGDDDRTRWADGPVHDVTVNVRTRAEPGSRGRTSKVVDDPLGRERLLAQAREVKKSHDAASAELASSAGQLDQVVLSGAAMAALCTLLTKAMAQRARRADTGQASDPRAGLQLRVHYDADRAMTIRSVSGQLRMHETVVELFAGGDGQ